MYQTLVHSTRPLMELSSNIHYSSSSTQYNNLRTAETRKALDLDLCKIAVPIPRSRLPVQINPNYFLGKRGPFQPAMDYGASKQLKSVSGGNHFERSLDRFLGSFHQKKVEVSGNFEKLAPKEWKQKECHESSRTQEQTRSSQIGLDDALDQDKDTKVTARRRNNMLEILQEFRTSRQKKINTMIKLHDSTNLEPLRCELRAALQTSRTQNKESSEIVSDLGNLLSKITEIASKNHIIQK